VHKGLTASAFSLMLPPNAGLQMLEAEFAAKLET
jgi:hypothetical protein